MSAREQPAGLNPRLAALACSYLAQGLTWGFVSSVLLPWFAARGTPLQDQAAIFVLGAAPWVIKVGWSPLLDRFAPAGSGRQRYGVVAGQVGMSLSVFALAALDDLFATPLLVGAIWLLHNLLMSLQDAATDALAIDVVPEAKRGRANAFMLGGHVVGMFLGSVGLGKLMAATDLSTALLAMAAAVLVLSPVTLLIPRDAAGDASPSGPLLAALKTAASRPGAVRLFALMAVAFVADASLSAVAQDFLVNRVGLTPQTIFEVVVPFDIGAQVVSYVALGVWLSRERTGAAAAVGAAALAILWAGFAAASGLWSSLWFLLGFMALQAGATAAFRTGLHGAAMNETAPKVRATHFALLMAALNLGRVVGGSAAPAAVEALDYVGLFLAAAGFQALVAVAIVRVLRRPPR